MNVRTCRYPKQHRTNPQCRLLAVCRLPDAERGCWDISRRRSGRFRRSNHDDDGCFGRVLLLGEEDGSQHEAGTQHSHRALQDRNVCEEYADDGTGIHGLRMHSLSVMVVGMVVVGGYSS